MSNLFFDYTWVSELQKARPRLCDKQIAEQLTKYSTFGLLKVW